LARLPALAELRPAKTDPLRWVGVVGLLAWSAGNWVQIGRRAGDWLGIGWGLTDWFEIRG
jgi:hypothetical protein